MSQSLEELKAGGGCIRYLRTLEGRVKVVTGVAFSADGRLLASGFMDNSVRLWDTPTGLNAGADGGREVRKAWGVRRKR